MELASVYKRLGAKVTIVEMLDRICPSMDPDISRALHKALEKQGIEFLLSSEVITSVKLPEEVVMTIKQGSHLQNISADVVLIAVGRRPFTEGLKLDKVGIQVDKNGFVPVDDTFRTSVPHIFAIGDLIKGAMLAHRASAEAVAVVEWIKGMKPTLDYLIIPNVVYTSPEVAMVGLTENEAQEMKLDIVKGIAYFKGNPRARCTDETEGFVKVIGDKKTGRLLGMHIIGSSASELISQGMTAIQKKATLRDLATAPTAHPTLSETVKEAAEVAVATGARSQ